MTPPIGAVYGTIRKSATAPLQRDSSLDSDVDGYVGAKATLKRVKGTMTPQVTESFVKPSDCP